jgi:hypothetical protein
VSIRFTAVAPDTPTHTLPKRAWGQNLYPFAINVEGANQTWRKLLADLRPGILRVHSGDSTDFVDTGNVAYTGVHTALTSAELSSIPILFQIPGAPQNVPSTKSPEDLTNVNAGVRSPANVASIVAQWIADGILMDGVEVFNEYANADNTSQWYSPPDGATAWGDASSVAERWGLVEYRVWAKAVRDALQAAGRAQIPIIGTAYSASDLSFLAGAKRNIKQAAVWPVAWPHANDNVDATVVEGGNTHNLMNGWSWHPYSRYGSGGPYDNPLTAPNRPQGGINSILYSGETGTPTSPKSWLRDMAQQLRDWLNSQGYSWLTFSATEGGYMDKTWATGGLGDLLETMVFAGSWATWNMWAVTLFGFMATNGADGYLRGQAGTNPAYDPSPRYVIARDMVARMVIDYPRQTQVRNDTPTAEIPATPAGSLSNSVDAVHGGGAVRVRMGLNNAGDKVLVTVANADLSNDILNVEVDLGFTPGGSAVGTGAKFALNFRTDGQNGGNTGKWWMAWPNGGTIWDDLGSGGSVAWPTDNTLLGPVKKRLPKIEAGDYTLAGNVITIARLPKGGAMQFEFPASFGAAGGGSAPANTTLPSITPTAPVQGQQLAGNAGAWTGGPTFAYQWIRCDAAGANGVDIAGATTINYTPVAADVGHTLRLRVIAVNANGANQATSLATGVVTAPPPAGTSPSVDMSDISNVAGQPAVRTMSLTLGAAVKQLLVYVTDTNLPSITSVTWNGVALTQRASVNNDNDASVVAFTLDNPATGTHDLVVTFGNAGRNCQIVPVAVKDCDPSKTTFLTGHGYGTTRTLSASTKGGDYVIGCAAAYHSAAVTITEAELQQGELTAGNGFHLRVGVQTKAADADPDVSTDMTWTWSVAPAGGSSGIVAVFEPAPVPVPANTTPPGITGQPLQGQVLTVVPGIWTNAPTSRGYQWQREGADIAGATATTYQLTAADVDHVIDVVETATNASGSASATSPTVGPVLAPSAPKLSTLTDDFDDNDTNLAKWVDRQDAGTVVVETHGRVEIQLSDTPAIGERKSLDLWNALADQTVIQVKAAGDQTIAGVYAWLQYNKDEQNAVGFLINQNEISGFKLVNNAFTGDLGSAPFTPYMWLRPREAAGVLYWEYANSPNGPWTELHHENDPIPLGLVQARFGGQGAAGANGSKVIFDNFNKGLSKPTALTQPALSGTELVGSTLTVDPGTWDDAVTVTRQWTRDDHGVGNYVDIAGATGQTYDLTDLDDDCDIACRIQATNPAGTTTIFAFTSGPIVQPDPVNVTPPTLSGSGRVGDPITLDLGDWLHMGGHDAYFTVQIQRSVNPPTVPFANSGDPIIVQASQGQTTYTPGAGDIGKILRAEVTPHNSGAP